MTPPASTEPVFGILLSELYEWERENLCWSEVQDLQQRIRARGPVSAQQQAPPEQCPCFAGDEHAYCLNRKNVHCGKAFSCILANRVAPYIPEDMLWELLNIACNDRPIENAEIYENVRQWICRLPSQYEHDAALIAEDRKRPRPPCEECIYQAQAAQAEAAERERVLKALIAVFEAFEDRKRFAYSADDIIEYIENFGRLESPRSQPEVKNE